MRIMPVTAKPVLVMSTLALGLSVGCTKKSPEAEKAEIGQEAAQDVAEERREGAEEMAESRQDIAETRESTQEDVAEINTEAREEVAEVNEEARDNANEGNEDADREGVPGFGASGDRAKDTGEQAEENKETFSKELSDKLNAFDDRIDTLEDRVDEKDESVKTSFQPKIAEVKAKRQAAATQLNMMKSADDTAWTSMREGVNQAFNELDSAVKEAEGWIQSH